MNNPLKCAKRSIVCLLAIVMAVLGQTPPTAVNAAPDPLATSAQLRASASPPSSAATQIKVAEAYGRAPLSFEATPGRTDDASAKFIARGSGYSLSLTSTEATFAFLRAGPPSATKEKFASMPEPIYSRVDADNNQPAALRISLRGANKAARARGVNELPGRNNYFIGSDPKKWRVNVPTYSRVEYENIYRGVDLVYYGDQRELEYDFIVAPGASYKVIRIGFEGAGVALEDSGDLVIEIRGEKVYQRKPVVYQEVHGSREAIAARYVLNSCGDAGFEIGAYDAKRPLIIDPVLSYSTYLGGGPISSVAVDRTGSAYVAGTFQLDTFNRITDAFVMKLNREGTAVLYSTFLGGSDRAIPDAIENRAFGIAVDSSGYAYVTGSTNARSFPTTPGAFQATLPGTIRGQRSAFVTKLNSTGDALVYSTYLAGADSKEISSQSSGQAIAVDEGGSAYVTGSTDSSRFPLVNPIQSINLGGTCISGDVAFFCNNDAFVSKLNSSGSALIYSTYLGGYGDDGGAGIAVDGAGSAYVVGTTSASSFPTKNPLQPSSRGSSDLFIAKLNAAGNDLIYSTILGGSGGDSATGVAVDSSGNAYVTGRTSSTDFPTSPGAFQAANESSPAFKSTDGGATWSAINRGLSFTDQSVRQIMIDPTNTSTLYANTDGGLFKSTDGGSSWRFLRSGASSFITSIAIDPTNSSILYAALFFAPGGGGVDKSTDGGKTWAPVGWTTTPGIPFSILIDPKVPTTLYATAQLIFGIRDGAGLFRSTDGGVNWFMSGEGLSLLPVSALALAPSKPKRLYAISGGTIFRSNNRANKWKPAGAFSIVFAASLVVDPLNPNTVYLGTPGGVYKSTDAAGTFASTSLHANIGLLAVDPRNPSIIYAAGGDFTNVDGNFKSTDAGESWKAMGRISGNRLATLAIDPNNSSIVYAGEDRFGLSADAFVAKINAAGTALIYSTYLGGTRDDIARSISVDAQGSAYLTGRTSSADFPIRGALQPRKLGAGAGYDAFLTRLDPSGDLIYSTYLGGSANDDGRAIALDAAGGLYIVGSTDSDDFPTLNPIQGTRNGRLGAGFVTKIVDTGNNEVGFTQVRRSQ